MAPRLTPIFSVTRRECLVDTFGCTRHSKGMNRPGYRDCSGYCVIASKAGSVTRADGFLEISHRGVIVPTHGSSPNEWRNGR
jgi:hypothetical protein